MTLLVFLCALFVAEGGSSIMSTVYTSEEITDATIEVGRGSLKLLYSTNEGKLSHYVNSRSLVCKFSQASAL